MKKSSSLVFQPAALVAMWNTLTDPPIPKCIKLTKAREAHARKRLLEHGPDWWRSVIVRMNASAFCRGESDRGWVASLDWLIANEDNALKVLEGKYDNRAPKTTARSNASPLPTTYDNWCDHDPPCNSREWHNMKVKQGAG